MQDLFMLYNEYYQKDLIKLHIEMLLDRGCVAFGKLRAKNKSYDASPSMQAALDALYARASDECALQLFLSDYANLYVARVVRATSKDLSDMAPAYYRGLIDGGASVEVWFLLSDMRELVRDDFIRVRDEYLVGLRTPLYDNKTYAVYGNHYDFPLIVEAKVEADYFTPLDAGLKSDKKDYKASRYVEEIYKDERYLGVRSALLRYGLGRELPPSYEPNTLRDIIYAIIEYEDNAHDGTYEFTAVIVKLARAIESEVYALLRGYSRLLEELDATSYECISYDVGNSSYPLASIHDAKPNIGAMRYLLKRVSTEVADYIKLEMDRYAMPNLVGALGAFASSRNTAVHENKPDAKSAYLMIKSVIGLGATSLVSSIVEVKVAVQRAEERLARAAQSKMDSMQAEAAQSKMDSMHLAGVEAGAKSRVDSTQEIAKAIELKMDSMHLAQAVQSKAHSASLASDKVAQTGVESKMGIELRADKANLADVADRTTKAEADAKAQEVLDAKRANYEKKGLSFVTLRELDEAKETGLLDDGLDDSLLDETRYSALYELPSTKSSMGQTHPYKKATKKNRPLRYDKNGLPIRD